MLNIDKIKSKLNQLKNPSKKSTHLWSPKPGKNYVRLVPYKFCPDFPFTSLDFHYINGKTYLSPSTYGRPDPVLEFSNKLKRTGDKEDWKQSRQFEPKRRTYVPILVRGEEKEGVKFWGFGKTVEQELLAIMSDPDCGDITDLSTGRDIEVEFKTAEETGKDFPETKVRAKVKVTPAVDPNDKEMLSLISNQVKINDLFAEPTYEDLKIAMDAWLNPENQKSTEKTTETTTTNTSVKESKSESVPKSEDVADAFDKLFNK